VSEQRVSYERRGPAALLEIRRPERRNAIDGPTAEALLTGYRRFEADPGALVLVLAGEGEAAFCAGADLGALETLLTRTDSPEGPLGFTRLISPKPTIAAISGWCVAGGLELALWCDLRIAAASARLGFLERRWGVPLIDGGTQRLPRIVGLGRALELILTGRVVEAGEALEMGMVNEVVPAGRHVERALELAAALAEFPRETMLADRQAAIDGLGMPLREGLRREARVPGGVLAAAGKGARRFAAGEGRGGAAAGSRPA
jgi:enoyl-CoA hydratase